MNQLVTVDAHVSKVAQMIQVRNHSKPVPIQIQLKETGREFKYKWYEMNSCHVQ